MFFCRLSRYNLFLDGFVEGDDNTIIEIKCPMNDGDFNSVEEAIGQKGGVSKGVAYST